MESASSEERLTRAGVCDPPVKHTAVSKELRLSDGQGRNLAWAPEVARTRREIIRLKVKMVKPTGL